MSPEPAGHPRLRRGGVRLYAALAASAGVLVALAVAAVLLVTLTRAGLTRGAETAITTRARDLAQLAASATLPVRLPTTQGTTAQVVDGNGLVVASTGDIAGQGPITSISAAPGVVATISLQSLDQGPGGGEEVGGENGDGGSGVNEEVSDENDGEGPYLAALTAVDTSRGRFTVIVAVSLASIDAAASALVPLLMVGIPVLVLLVGSTTWFLAGRTLRPVRAMSEEAERITVTDLGRRIPLPGTRDEIRGLGETLNRMLSRLDTSVTLQRRFVGDASHELKSPVAALLTMAEVASRHPERIDLASFALHLETEVRRLGLLVDDLLTLARSDEGAFDLEPGVFDLAALVAEETAHLESSAAKPDLSGVERADVEADRRRITQVVRNLVDNAARHTRTGIWIETRCVHDQVELVVADDGPGIPPADRQRAFERFVRLDDGRGRVEGGTGLGLAVVQAIVQAHGGSVEFTDHDRHPGAVIRVRLPAVFRGPRRGE
jgi:signal transduction histidine kinase